MSLLDEYKELAKRRDNAWDNYEVALENKSNDLNRLYLIFRELEAEARGMAKVCQSILANINLSYHGKKQIRAVVEKAKKDGVKLNEE